MLKCPSPLAKKAAHKLAVTRNGRDSLDQHLYAVAFILLQRQMRKRWA
jgi:hypothetical protein